MRSGGKRPQEAGSTSGRKCRKKIQLKKEMCKMDTKNEIIKEQKKELRTKVKKKYPNYPDEKLKSRIKNPASDKISCRI